MPKKENAGHGGRGSQSKDDLHGQARRKRRWTGSPITWRPASRGLGSTTTSPTRFSPSRGRKSTWSATRAENSSFRGSGPRTSWRRYSRARDHRRGEARLRRSAPPGVVRAPRGLRRKRQGRPVRPVGDGLRDRRRRYGPALDRARGDRFQEIERQQHPQSWTRRSGRRRAS